MNAQHNDQQRQVGHRFAMSGNMQQQPGFQISPNPHSPTDLFGQNHATASAPTEASASALLQNLTALAKLDQLTSEQQQQQSVNMQHQAEYQNVGHAGSGDRTNMRTQRYDLLRSSCNSSQHQMAAQLPVQQ